MKLNKRLILSSGMLVFVAAVVAGGTGAFFSDTETSTGNVFTAGSVSIGFGGIDHVYAYGDGSDPVEGYFTTTTQNNIPRFALDDLKPRDAGRLTFDLDNGANDAYVCGLVAGDPGENLSDADQALYDNLQFYDSNDDQVTPGDWFDLGSIDANMTGEYEIDYCFGEGQGTACNVEAGVDYNAAQNGSFSADLVLYAVQQRNNDDFSCDDLTLNNDGEPVYSPDTASIETGEGWAPIASDQSWFAKSRNNDPTNFEVAVGTDDTDEAAQEEADNTWVAGTDNTFTLSYDASAGTATYEAGGVTVTDTVGSGPFSTLAITAKSPNSDTTTIVDNLALDISPGLTPDNVSATGGNQYLQITGLDFSQDWTLTGEFNFSDVGTGTGFSQENPAVQFSIN